MRLRLISLSAVLTLGPGCNSNDACGSRTDPVTGFDGGIYTCLEAQDCPRGSNVSVCVTDVAEAKECVRCEQTHCVLSVPLRCP